MVIGILLMCWAIPGWAQNNGAIAKGGNGWDRTRDILECAPRLVDRRDLVEDKFEHRYITNNPSDVEVGYFSVEPVTYFEEGMRVCESSVPAAGVSQNWFSGIYETTYMLPGNETYRIEVESNALIFNNGIRIINAQDTRATIRSFHRVEVEIDSLMSPDAEIVKNSVTAEGYTWEIDVKKDGTWRGNLTRTDLEMRDHQIPSGISGLTHVMDLKGPGRIVVRESVSFEILTNSGYKYDPIFQAACLFSLEPLSVTAKLLPCGF